MYRLISSNQSYIYNDLGSMTEYSNDFLAFCNANPYGGAFGFITDEFPTHEVIGRPPIVISTQLPTSVFTEKPKQVPYTAELDYHHYGNRMVAAAGYASGIAANQRYDRLEHQVTHVTFQGDIQNKTPEPDWIVRPGNVGPLWLGAVGHQWVRVPGVAAPVCTIIHVGDDGHGFPVYYTYYQHSDFLGASNINIDGFELLHDLLNRRPSISESVGSVGHFEWSFEEVRRNEKRASFSSVDFTYVFRKVHHGTPFDTISSWRVSVKLSSYIEPVYGTLDDEQWHNVHSGVFKLVSDCKVEPLGIRLAGLMSANYASNPLEFTWGDATAGLITRPRNTSNPPLVSNFEQYRRSTLKGHLATSDNTTLHREFADLFEARLPGFRPASFYAAGDSLEKAISESKLNLLEMTHDLADIGALLPDTESVQSAIAKALRGDLAAIKEAIDVITNHILKIRFGIDPSIDDIDTILSLELESIRRLTAPIITTSYGQFRYVFLEDENPLRDGKLELIARAKVRFVSDPSTVMGAALVANSVGLLPTLSRIWETLPFSFVVDWLTNMSRRLHDVDNQIFWLAMRVHLCMYSYTVEYTPSAEVLDLFDLEQMPGCEPFRLRMYVRELSHYTPRLMDSPYDFRRPRSSPDPVTVGSLLWQVLP
jgi:hypothetical protein